MASTFKTKLSPQLSLSMGSHYAAQTILLLLAEYWEYRQAPSCLTSNGDFYSPFGTSLDVEADPLSQFRSGLVTDDFHSLHCWSSGTSQSLLQCCDAYLL